MMVAARVKESEKSENPLDKMMTPAQIARRKFKSSLPRKIENRRLSAQAALGELFTLLDRFRSMIETEMHSAEAGETLMAALVYCLPESKPAMLADTLTVPDADNAKLFGDFCRSVLALDRPLFLGVVFLQVDPDAQRSTYRAVSFVTQFMTGPEAEGRLRYAQEKELLKIQRDLEKRFLKAR
jgi:hypothetical protein